MSTNLEGLPQKRFYRTAEIADYADIPVRTIRYWCDTGRIKFVRWGPQTIRIPRDEIVRIIRFSNAE